MQLKLEKFEIHVKNYSDGAILTLSDLDREEVINQLDPIDVAKVLDIPTMLQHVDHHELITAIGDIEKFVEAFGKDAILDWIEIHENEEEQ